MQVDFYHLTRDPAAKMLPAIAQKCVGGGERLLIVSADAPQLDAIGEALWSHAPESFLANGRAGGQGDADQPILLSDSVEASNGARYIALADGRWRDEALGFERIFYCFEPSSVEDARSAWRALAAREDVTPRYWKQEDGRWVEGP